MRILLLLVAMLGSMIHCVHSQPIYTIRGTLTSETGESLPGASILLNPGSTGLSSDRNGQFIIPGVKAGDYRIQVSFLGYETFHDSLSVFSDQVLKIRLRPLAVSLAGITITDSYKKQREKELPMPVEVLDEQFIREFRSGSLMKTLERIPGVSTIDIGSGQSKPMLRGLSFNRVVVAENGIKHESQQWGADHGLEIDQYAVDRAEVIKGPASLMYGSDAIAGIIDLRQTGVPEQNSIGGSLELSGKTNNRLAGASTELFMRKKSVFLTARMTGISYGDYRVPADSIDIYSYKAALYKRQMRNTAGNELNAHLSLGILLKDFSNRLYISTMNSKMGFFANAHGLEPRRVNTSLHDASSRDIQYPYHQVFHHKWINRSELKVNNWRFLSELGYQHNFRQEKSNYVSHGYMPSVFPDELPFASNLELEFDKTVLSGNLRTEWNITDHQQLVAGFNNEYQKNRIDGRAFIIPAFTQNSIGSFIYSRSKLNAFTQIQAGIRVDHGKIRTQSYSDWFATPVVEGNDTVLTRMQRAVALDRGFSSLSWSAGLNYHPGKMIWRINLGKSFRMPIAKELAANGVNYHHFSYEIGDPGLSAEVSYQLDAGFDYESEALRFGISPFINYFPNYIYLNPTSEHDRYYGNGNQVFRYAQGKVFRHGTEFHLEYTAFRQLAMGLSGEYVNSVQLSGSKRGFPLPFTPPMAVLASLRYTADVFPWLKKAYSSVDLRVTARQTHIVPPEEITPGHLVFNLGAGGVFLLGRQQFMLSMQVQNLFNTTYYNHSSYYRLIHVPEPGRNLIMNLMLPFPGKRKS